MDDELSVLFFPAMSLSQWDSSMDSFASLNATGVVYFGREACHHVCFAHCVGRRERGAEAGMGGGGE